MCTAYGTFKAGVFRSGLQLVSKDEEIGQLPSFDIFQHAFHFLRCNDGQFGEFSELTATLVMQDGVSGSMPRLTIQSFLTFLGTQKQKDLQRRQKQRISLFVMLMILHLLHSSTTNLSSSPCFFAKQRIFAIRYFLE